jgi:hypothetical protein
MRSDFLENESGDYASGGIAGVAGSLYGWSALSMLAEFQKTGQYYVPWTGKILGRPGPYTLDMVGRKTFGILPLSAGPKRSGRTIGKVLGKQPFAERNLRESIFGSKFIGKGSARGWGMAQLGVSRAINVGLSTMTWTDPVFFAFRYAANPMMWPVGILYYGGMNTWGNAARAMERTRYVDMSQPFVDTQASFTSRQRAVRAISESQLQARSAIGNEAQLFHR